MSIRWALSQRLLFISALFAAVQCLAADPASRPAASLPRFTLKPMTIPRDFVRTASEEFGKGRQCRATNVTASGKVAGTGYGPTSGVAVIRWDEPDKPVVFLVGRDDVIVCGLLEDGTIFGSIMPSGGKDTEVGCWSVKGQFTALEIPQLPGKASRKVQLIGANAAGEAVGNFSFLLPTPNTISGIIQWDAKRNSSVLSPPANAKGWHVSAMADNGTIVGAAAIQPGPADRDRLLDGLMIRPFIRDAKGQLQFLDKMPRGDPFSNNPTCVSPAGTFVGGKGSTTSGRDQPLRWNARGHLTQLPIPSEDASPNDEGLVTAINDSGEAIGTYDSGDASKRRAAFWDAAGGFHHLDDLLDDSGSNWQLISVSDMSGPFVVAMARDHTSGMEAPVLLRRLDSLP